MRTYAAGKPRPKLEPVEPYYTRAAVAARSRSQCSLQASSPLPQSRGKERPDWDTLQVARPVLVLRRGGSRRPVLDLEVFAAGQAAKVLEELNAVCEQEVTCLVSKAAGKFVVDSSFRAQDWEEEQWRLGERFGSFRGHNPNLRCGRPVSGGVPMFPEHSHTVDPLLASKHYQDL